MRPLLDRNGRLLRNATQGGDRLAAHRRDQEGFPTPAGKARCLEELATLREPEQLIRQ